MENEHESLVVYRSKRFAVLRGEGGGLLLASLQPDGSAWSVVRHPPGPEADALLKDIGETNVHDPFQRQWMDQEIANRIDDLTVQQEPQVLALPAPEQGTDGRSLVAYGMEGADPSEPNPMVAASRDSDTDVRVPVASGVTKGLPLAWMARDPEILDAEYTEIIQEPATGEVGDPAPKEIRKDIPLLGRNASSGPASPEVPGEFSGESPDREGPARKVEDAPGSAGRTDPSSSNRDILDGWPGLEKTQRSLADQEPNDGTPPKPKRIPIGDLRPEVLTGKKALRPYTPVRFYDDRNRHVMTDEGYRLNIRMRASGRESVLLAALKEGQERYGEPVRIAGNPVFMAKMAKLAIEQGIEIAPDGPFKAVAERELRKAQGRDLGSGTIGGGPDLPEERFQPGKGRIDARVRSVSEDAVVLHHAGREKLLDVPIPSEHRHALKEMEGQRVVLQFGAQGLERVAPAPHKGRGLELG